MKKFAIAVALGATLAASAASASEQRPTYIAFKPSSATSVAAPVAPAGPSVAKRSNLKGGLVIPLVVGAGAVGLALALSGGSDGSPN